MKQLNLDTTSVTSRNFKSLIISALLLLFSFIPLIHLSALDRDAANRQFDFQYAVAREDIAAAEKLLKEGADPNLLPENLLREESGDEDYYSIDFAINNRPIALAMSAGNKAMVKMLLENGASITIDKDTIDTTLYFGFDDLALQELKSRAESWTESLPEELLGGDYPLVLKAARAGNAELVRFFLSHGEDIFIQNKQGPGLLHAAAEGNLPGIIQLCLDNGMDINTPDPWDNTALNVAMSFSSPEALLYLMEKGAEFDPDSVSRQCIYYGLFDVTRKIYADYPEVEYNYTKAFWNALLTGNKEIIEYYRAKTRPEEYMALEFQWQNILHPATAGGYMPVIRELIETEKYDPFAVSGDNPSPAYMAAADSHNPEAVRYFLDLGWDPNEAPRNIPALSSLLIGQEPLNEGDIEIIRILMEAGVKIAEACGKGAGVTDTPLACAISFGKPEILRMFLETEEVNTVLAAKASGYGSTTRDADPPLNTLIRAGYRNFNGEFPDLCRLMLEKGADLSTDYLGTYALSNIVEKQDDNLFSLLTGYTVRPGIEKSAYAAMNKAAYLGRLRYIQRLVDAGISPNINVDHTTPLGEAVIAGQTDAVRLLLENGAEPDMRSADNKLPLELVPDGSQEIQELLKQYGASDPSDHSFGAEDLINAVKSGDLSQVGVLIVKGADPDAAGAEGIYPIEIAAAAGRMEMVKLLIGGGARVNETDSGPVKPLEKALENRHYELFRYLLTQGARPDRNALYNSIMRDVIQTGDINLITDTIRHSHLRDADELVFYNIGEYRSMLHIAAGEGNLDTVKFFIEIGASVDEQSTNGITPLISAAAQGNVDMINLLLDWGADPNKEADKETIRLTTPLMAASAANSSECIKLLLKAGADASAQNENGETALDLAKSSEVRTLLEETGAVAAVGPDAALANAVRYMNYGEVLKALKDGADPDTEAADGFPVLLTAVKQTSMLTRETSFLIVDALLAAGADPNCRNRVQQTPLFDAVGPFRGIEIGLLLLKYGADPDLMDRYRQSAFDEEMVNDADLIMLKLYYAVLGDDLGEFQRVLAEMPDFDLESHDVWGRTLLTLAFEEQATIVADYLVAEGAHRDVHSTIFPGYLRKTSRNAGFMEKISMPGDLTLAKIADYTGIGFLKALIEE